MKYYNIYAEGHHVLLFDTEKFEVVSAFWKESFHKCQEFEGEPKHDNGEFAGYDKKDDLKEYLANFIDKLDYDKGKGSCLVLYPNGEWDIYDDFDGVYTKTEVRHDLVVFKRINELPADYRVNHWNGSGWKKYIAQLLTY